MPGPNIHAPAIDEVRDQLPGYVASRARAGAQAGAERLGLSVWLLPPGQAAYPYHFHLVEEEMIVVLEGTPTLRTPDGTRTLEHGEVVALPAGERGAHQLLNDTGSEVRFLSISTSGEPDIFVYPDQQKVGVSDRRDRAIHHFFHLGDAVGIYDGLEPR